MFLAAIMYAEVGGDEAGEKGELEKSFLEIEDKKNI
jgi:hypothetical protein